MKQKFKVNQIVRMNTINGKNIRVMIAEIDRSTAIVRDIHGKVIYTNVRNLRPE